MVVERGDQRLQLGEQLPPLGHREGADDADGRERAVILVQPEQQRADRVGAGLVQPVAGDDAVGRALVLDLEHDALVRLVGDRQRLGDDAVEARALELVEPALRESPDRWWRA